MKFLDMLPWLIVAIVVIVIVSVILWKQNAAEKALTAQKQADKALINNVSRTFRSGELDEYKALPDFTARLEWLKEHRPDFMEAASREPDPNASISYWVDRQIIQAPPNYHSTVMQYEAQSISLNTHQEYLDTLIEEYRKKEAAAQAERARQAAEKRKREDAARAYWESLSEEQKETFKKAQGSKARQSVLQNSNSRSDYSADVLYPIIMSAQFSGVSCDTSQSITYCETSTHHSSYDGGGGSHSYHDGGSYSDSGGGSDGGGGGGGD